MRTNYTKTTPTSKNSTRIYTTSNSPSPPPRARNQSSPQTASSATTWTPTRTTEIKCTKSSRATLIWPPVQWDAFIAHNYLELENMAYSLQAVLSTLKDHELLVKGSKSELFRLCIEFLGFQISHDGWAPTESKVEAVVNWLAFETVKHLLSFLKMANLLIFARFSRNCHTTHRTL